MTDTEAANEGLMSIDDAVDLLKSSRSTVYRWLHTGKLKGVKVGRQWRVAPEEVERFLRGDSPRMESPPGVDAFVATLDGLIRAKGAEPTDGSGPPAMTAVLRTAQLALESGATQFSLEPQLEEDGQIRGWLRMRIDGSLATHATADARSVAAVVEGWKIWAGCDPHKRREIQHGRAVLQSGGLGGTVEFRVTFVPTVLGESVSIGVLDSARVAEYISLDRIDYSPTDRARLDEALQEPYGTIVFTGPTTSGKTSSLWACLKQLAGPHLQTIAIEGVTEWRLPGVVQIPVDSEAGVTFPAAIRAALRCAPDVVMVSEIPDAETLHLVPSIALVGHLVLTALHATTALEALHRMIEFGLERPTVAESMRLFVAQQLVRRLCDQCAVSAEPTRIDLQRAHEIAEAGGLPASVFEGGWREPVGCDACSRTGYRGRRVIAETVQVTDRFRAALLGGAGVEELREIAIADGTTTLAADGVRRAAAGETTLDEVWRVLGIR